MSVLPCDLLVESGVKIGKVGEVGDKSIGYKCEFDERVGGLHFHWGLLAVVAVATQW